jgi:hypothetical protein
VSVAGDQRSGALDARPRPSAGGGSQLYNAGRTLGVICGAFVFVAAVYLLATIPGEENVHLGQGGAHRTQAHSYGSLLWMPTFVGSGLAVSGAVSGRPLLLVSAFLVGFFWNFLGLYFLLLPPGIPSLIGYGEVGYFVSAALLARGKPERPS